MGVAGRSDGQGEGLLPRVEGLAHQGAMRAAIACVLCVLMIDQPLMAGATVVKRGPSAGAQQMKSEGRVLHALNRLTFGPRPGDVAAVEAMGLTTWFENQLNSSKIDDSALDARLAQFPAMQLPQAQLMARYPSQQVIRQMAQRNMWMPSDPVERAIYGDQMAFYKEQQANKAVKDAAAATAAAAGNPDPMASDTMTAGAAATATPEPAAERWPPELRTMKRWRVRRAIRRLCCPSRTLRTRDRLRPNT